MIVRRLAKWPVGIPCTQAATLGLLMVFAVGATYVGFVSTAGCSHAAEDDEFAIERSTDPTVDARAFIALAMRVMSVTPKYGFTADERRRFEVPAVLQEREQIGRYLLVRAIERDPKTKAYYFLALASLDGDCDLVVAWLARFQETHPNDPESGRLLQDAITSGCQEAAVRLKSRSPKTREKVRGSDESR